MKSILPAALLYSKALLCLLGLSLTALSASGQSNPAAQTLPYSQSFVSSSFSILPAGWAAWNGMDGNTVSTQALAEATVPSGDVLFAATNSIPPFGGVFGYGAGGNGRLYIQTGSEATNGVNQVALAINTTGRSGIRVTYDVEIISAQPRTVGIVMQYRVGTSGSWTTVPAAGNPYSQAGGTTGIKANVSLTLPSAADNQSVVQLRWATWRGTESGNSSGIAIDNISVCSAPVFSLGASPSVCQGVTTTTLSYTPTSGFNAPNQYSIDFDAAAEAAGFTDVPLTALPASPINITVPGAAAAALYNGTLTIRNGCGLSSTADFTLTVNANVTPSVSISANPGNTISAGTEVTFTATANNTGGGTVTYNFKVDGGSVQNGASNTYASTSLVNGNQVSCDISISGGNCLTASTASSNTITMTVNTNSTTPAISITGNGNQITNRASTASPSNDTDFGSVGTGGGMVSRTFTINNTATGSPLVLTGTPLVTIADRDAVDFTVTAQPAASIGGNGSTTFTIKFQPGATGLRTAIVIITHNDLPENPFIFTVQGTGL